MEFKAQTILKQLKDVTEWHQLGIQLNVALSELRNIEQNYPRDAERCKSEMVNIWLKQDNDASWWKLAQALYTVGCHVLSKELSQLDQREYHKKEQEPIDDDTERSQPVNAEQTQIEKVLRSDQPHEIRRTLPDDRKCCMLVSWCLVLFSLNLTAVVYIWRSLKSDAEKGIIQLVNQQTYATFMCKLFTEQELLLWLSCFIICAVWILAQYILTTMPEWKTTVKCSAIVCCLLVLVGIIYFHKNIAPIESIKMAQLIEIPAAASMGMTAAIILMLYLMCCPIKHFCLQTLVVLSSMTLSAMAWPIWVKFFTAPELQQGKGQEDIQSKVQEQMNAEGTVWMVDAFIFLSMWVPPVIFIIFAKLLPIYRTMYQSLWYLSIMGVIIVIFLVCVLQLKVSLDRVHLYSAIYLLTTNIALLIVTTLVKGLPSIPLEVWCKDLVVYFGLFIGVRNLLMEVLVLWETFS